MCLGVFVYAFGFIGNVRAQVDRFAARRIDGGRAAGQPRAARVFRSEFSGMARPTSSGGGHGSSPSRPNAARMYSPRICASFCCSGSGGRWAAPCGIFRDRSAQPDTPRVCGRLGRLVHQYRPHQSFGSVWRSAGVAVSQGREYTPLPFQTPAFYRYVRHPLYVGWFMVFWSTPTMTSPIACLHSRVPRTS